MIPFQKIFLKFAKIESIMNTVSILSFCLMFEKKMTHD